MTVKFSEVNGLQTNLKEARNHLASFLIDLTRDELKKTTRYWMLMVMVMVMVMVRSMFAIRIE